MQKRHYFFHFLVLLLCCGFQGRFARCDDVVPIKVVLQTDKAQYIQREPIRLLAFVQSTTPDKFSVTYNPREGEAARFEYFWLSQAGQTVPAGMNGTRRQYIDFVPPLDTWQADPANPDRYWIPNRFLPGVVRFQATFTPFAGPWAGKVVHSNTIQITIREPQGTDKAAYDFLQEPDRVHANLRHDAFIHTSGSHHSRRDHEYLQQEHGSSLYSFYTRRMMARDFSYEDEDLYQEKLEQIVQSAPKEFPLLADSYVDLLARYKELGQLEKMAILAEQVKQQQVSSADPQVQQRLHKLQQEIEAMWPPKTAEQRLQADKAALLVAAQEAAKVNSLTVAMTAIYGKGRQPGTYAYDVVDSYPTDSASALGQGQTWGMCFYDPRQSWPLNVKVFVNKAGVLDKTELSGALESYGVGPLKQPLEKLKQEQGLDTAAALKQFIQATIQNDVLKGRMSLPGNQKKEFVIPLSKPGN